MKDKNLRRILLQRRTKEGLYQLSPTASVASTPQVLLIEKQYDILNWRRTLGHPSSQVLSQVLKSCMPNLSINKTDVFCCSACQMGKNHKLPFQLSLSRASKPFQIIHTDIWGLAPVQSKNGYRFYVIFVDKYNRFFRLYPLKHKSEALPTFIQFKNMIEKQLETSIKAMHSDLGRKI